MYPAPVEGLDFFGLHVHTLTQPLARGWVFVTRLSDFVMLSRSKLMNAVILSRSKLLHAVILSLSKKTALEVVQSLTL